MTMDRDDFDRLREAGVFERAGIPGEGFFRDGDRWVQARPWFTVETDYRDGRGADWIEVLYFADETSARQKYAERVRGKLPDKAVQNHGVSMWVKAPGYQKVPSPGRAPGDDRCGGTGRPDFDQARALLAAAKQVGRRPW